MIKNDELLAVTGGEALYPMFFKEYVVRRKTDLVNPKVFSLGDVELPRNSMFIYTPKHADDLGPSNQEPFISNYSDDIFIGFESQLRIIAGKARPLPLEERKVIQKYRAGHYRYKYLKNINSAMKREKDLIVINTSLGQRKWNYIINRFTQFDRSYNQLNNLMDTINLKTQNNERQVFFKIELPDLIPVYTKFLEISRHYKKAFTKDENDNLIFNGINDQAIKPLRNTGAYWLIDWFNFLIGEYEYSLFNRINPEVLDKVNFILTKNGKCVIIKPGLLKEWLDELNEIKDDVVNTYTSQRVNAVKRTMTILMKLVSTEYLDLDTENEKEDQSSTSKDTKGGQGKEPESQNKESIETDTDESTDHDDDLFTTLLMGNDRSNETSNEDEGTDKGGVRSSSDTEVEPESWTSEIDDSQFDTIEETGPVDTRLGKTGFDTPSKGVEVALERLARTGKLSLSQRDFYLAQSEKYRDLAMPDGTSLEDFIILDTELLNNLPRKLKAPKDLKGITDEKYLESSVQVFKTGYVTEFLEKDIVRSILAVQNGGVCLTGFEKSSVENADGEYDVYNISLLPVGGKQTTFPIKVPKIRPDGTFVVDGQKRTKALQRRDIPVRKLDHYRVGLTSYYGRKLIVSRSKAVKDDYGLWLSKQIRVKSQAGEIELQVGGQPQYKIPVPKTYSDLAKRFRSLKCKDIEFIFSTKQLLEKDPTLRSLMTAESTVVGFKNNHPVILDDHGNLSFKGKVFDTFENFLGIDTRKAPVEFAEININGFKFPMGVVLSYFFGFDNLLKMLNVPYRTVPGGQRIKLEKDEFPLQFADETLIFNRRDPMSRLIFGGMSRLKNLGIFNRIDMNDPGVWVTVINNPKVKHTHFKEMSNMFDYFIDPITREELVKWGYSTSFDYLLLEATELLKTDKHEHEVEIQEQRFVGYESIAGSVYRQITKAVCKSRAQPNPDTAKISVHPEAVMLEAGLLDTAIDLVEEVSPVHEVKEQEVVTFGGNDGRDPDSMVRRTRGQLPSYIGIISEAGKDSGRVGYVTYTTSNPKVADYRGNVDVNADVGNVGLGSITMNLLGGLNQDDPKRSIRPTHWVTDVCIYS